MTIISSKKNIIIPYGVLETKNNNFLKKMIEKPKFNFEVNTGTYFFNKKIFNYFNKNRKMDINNLIENLIKKREKIGVFSIENKRWTDLGNWHDYNMKTKKSVF